MLKTNPLNSAVLNLCLDILTEAPRLIVLQHTGALVAACLATDVTNVTNVTSTCDTKSVKRSQAEPEWTQFQTARFALDPDVEYAW